MWASARRFAPLLGAVVVVMVAYVVGHALSVAGGYLRYLAPEATVLAPFATIPFATLVGVALLARSAPAMERSPG